MKPSSARDPAGLLRQSEQAALAATQFTVAPAAMKRALDPHYTTEEIASVVTPIRTLQRRIAKGETLTEDETDRAVRLARIADHAQRVFGDHEKAARWLRKSNATLDGRKPIELLRTETGARKVEEALIRIDHGIFA